MGEAAAKSICPAPVKCRLVSTRSLGGPSSIHIQAEGAVLAAETLDPAEMLLHARAACAAAERIAALDEEQ